MGRKLIKMKNLNIKVFSLTLLFFSLVMTWSCDEEDPKIDNSSFGPADYAALEALVTEVETYLENAKEGVNSGDHPPGSFASFRVVLDDVKESITKGVNEQLAKRAFDVLTEAFEEFQLNVVAPANPWIQRDNANSIIISDDPENGNEGDLMALFNAGNPFTVELDVFPASLQQTGFSNALISTAAIGPDNGFVVRYFDDGRFEIIVGRDGGSWEEGKSPGGAIAANKWSNVSLVYDGSLNFKLFLDGNQIITLDVESYGNSGADGELLDIGNLVGFSRPIDGLVRELKVWNKALSASELGQDADGDEDGLSLYFPFDANLGTSFNSFDGKFVAELQANVIWVAGGSLGNIVVDYSELTIALNSARDIITNRVEGLNDGDLPPNTKSVLQAQIDIGNQLIQDEAAQLDVDAFTESLTSLVERVQRFVVGPADGIFIDGNDPSAIGLRVTPTTLPTGDFSVVVDVKVDDLVIPRNEGYMVQSGAWIVRYTGFNGPDDSDARKNDAGKIQFFMNDGDWKAAITPFSVIVPGKWINITATYEAATQTQRVYVDGTLAASAEGTGTVADFGAEDITIGYGFQEMVGSLRNFQYWNKTLSAEEISNVIDLNNVNGDEDGLDVFLPLNRVLGLSFTDETGGHNAEVRGIDWNIQ